MKKVFIFVLLFAILALNVAPVAVIAAESNAKIPPETSTVETFPEAGADSFVHHALPTMFYGMAGIFIVLGLIAVAIIALNKVLPNKELTF